MREPICVYVFFFCMQQKDTGTHAGCFYLGRGQKSDRERKFEERRPGLEKTKIIEKWNPPADLQKSLSARFALLVPLVARIEKAHTEGER